MKIKSILPAAIILIFLFSCTESGPTLTAGKNFDPNSRRFKKQKKMFQIGEEFALLLNNVKLTDSYLDLNISTLDKKNISRTLQLKNVDTSKTYVLIPRFSLPIPTRYRLKISQLGKELAKLEIIIKNTASLEFGLSIDSKKMKIKNKRYSFKEGQNFVILLNNIKLKGKTITMSVFSIGKNGRKRLSNKRIFKNIDPSLSYIVIPYFSLPFATRYQLRFSQQGRLLAEKSITITKAHQ